MIIGTDSNIRNLLCYGIYCIIVWHVLKIKFEGYSFVCRHFIAFLIVNLRRKKTVVLPVTCYRAFSCKNVYEIEKDLFPYFVWYLSRTIKTKNDIEYENKLWKVEFDSYLHNKTVPILSSPNLSIHTSVILPTLNVSNYEYSKSWIRLLLFCLDFLHKTIITKNDIELENKF